MTLDELVGELRSRNVRIFDDEKSFRLRAPKGIITPQLLEIITSYAPELLYLVRLGDVRVCPSRWEHRPHWKYSAAAQSFICCACRHEAEAAA